MAARRTRIVELVAGIGSLLVLIGLGFMVEAELRLLLFAVAGLAVFSFFVVDLGIAVINRIAHRLTITEQEKAQTIPAVALSQNQRTSTPVIHG